MGVRAFGSYRGDAGENIDTISGNLNFTNPVIKPFGRGNWSLPFNLSYNSQIWRHDSAGDWLLGQDVGYGMGWKLQVGSITPIWSSSSTIDHYLFTDSSGAEYSLNVNTSGVWTSLEGTYVNFIPSTRTLYFNDGSYWVMDCTSASGEQDAGTMYPTLAENSNGNQITITYWPGIGSSASNTSARFSTVVDTRMTYQFYYAQVSPSDNIQHLTIITGAPGESWTLQYSSANLASPVSGASYGTTDTLMSLEQSGPGVEPPATYFTYNASAEMTQYTTALGGSISWGYTSNTYSGGATLREVNTRSMNQGAGGFTNTHTLSHPSSCENNGNNNGAYHGCTQIHDGGAGSNKIYSALSQSYPFPPGNTQHQTQSIILPSKYQETDNNGSTLLLEKDFTWGQNLAGAEFLSGVATTLNPGSSAPATTSTAQTIDAYGNLTQQQIYDYFSSSVTRTYNFTYVTNGNYTGNFMRNLLSQATVTVTGGSALTLVSNSYDQYDNVAQSGVSYPQHDSAYGTSVTYRGNLSSSTKLGTLTSYYYDIAGNVVQTVDGDGMSVVSVPDPNTGSVPSLLTPNTNSNLATSLSYSAYLQPLSVTGPNTATESQSFDNYNRLLSTTSVDGAVTTYTYTYGPNTQTATTQTTASTATCASGIEPCSVQVNSSTANTWKRNTFDGFGRIIKTQTGHDSTTINTVDTVYGPCGCSPLGKVIKVSMPYGPGETEVWTTYAYDGSGRQLTSTAPDGSVTTMSYSGNSVTTTDPAGLWKVNASDSFGNLIGVYEPNPSTGSNTNGALTTYAYNGANQLTSVSMTRNDVSQNRTFTYIGSDLVGETTPEGGTVTYTYDGNHHVLTRIDALNQKTAYTYDGYERLTLVQHFSWGPNPYSPPNNPPVWNEVPSQDVNYYYDTPYAKDYTQNYTWGRLSAVTFQSEYGGGVPGASLTYEYNYNQAGRVAGNRTLASQLSAATNLDLQAQYTWDNQGRITSMTYPSGPAMNYQYDAVSRATSMTEVASGQTIVAASATYGSAGQVLTLNGAGWPTGYSNASMNETRTYNNMLQLVHLVGGAQNVTSNIGPPPTTTTTGGNIDMQYFYNTGHNNGRVTQTIDNVLGETVNYTYDWLHRLTTAAATTWVEQYAYDGFGNLTGKTPTAGNAPSYTGASGSNNTGGALNGSAGSFDMENRLTGSNTTGSMYLYDPWGRRVWAQTTNPSNQQTTFQAYFYGATGQKLETYNCTVSTDGNAMLNCGLVGGINTYFAGKMLSEMGVFLSTDRLGSVRADSNGATMSYFPWGEERTSTANGRTKFAGYYRDQVGQDYAMARYYNANTGAFFSQDPGSSSTADSKNPTSWNRYAYTTGDPVNFKDPTGTLLAWAGDGNCGSDWMWNASLSGPCCDPNGNGFLLGEAPDPACYAGGGGNDLLESPPTPAAPPPDCALELEYTGVKSLQGAANHAAVVVTDEYGYTFTMEGFPQQVNPFSGCVQIGPVCAPIYVGWGLLVPQNSPGNVGDTQWGNTLTSTTDPSLCAQVDAIESAESYYSNHEVLYNGFGPNSNSFASWLLQSGGVSQYFSQPPRTYGWNTPLYGH